ncbi:MAG: hypothetical protein Q7T55_24160, partial [Solirubrobacteraceae bacterium]|nr:hypothetical protein [Solirubrobacteraceae bacterium]
RLDANPCHLARAHELYAQSAYSSLTRRFGVDKIFILSAGWGLIQARFFTPDYDITFSTAANVAPHARRTKSKSDYKDFQLMPDDGEEIIFLGGKDYLPFFCDLTRNLEGGKWVFFSSQSEPTLGPGFVAERFPTARRTNWHYECAQALIEGELK